MNKNKLTDVANVLDNSLMSKKIKIESILEQDIINFISVPSLENIAIVNIVIKLWKEPDINLEINKLVSSTGYFSYKHFYQVEEKVSEKLSRLSLPNLLRDKASNSIRYIGLEIIHWISNAAKECWFINSAVEYIDSLCWTVKGTIDKAKTFELLLNSKKLQGLYSKACEYCLEVCIAELWKQMPKEIKENSFYSENIYQSYSHHLVAYWTCSTKYEMSNLLNRIKPFDCKNLYDCNDSMFKNMISLSVTLGNAVAVKYFWLKLTDREIDNNIMKWTCLAMEDSRNKDNSDLFYFLLSQMNDKEQQKDIFEKYSGVVLKSLFLDWPWQNFLFLTIQLMWNYLDYKVYVDLLATIIKEIKKGRCNEKLLKKVWYISPNNFKKYFIQHIIDSNEGLIDVLWNLFVIEDMEIIKLILNDANVEEKKLIIFSSIQSNLFRKLIYSQKFTLIEELIENILSDTCAVENFKLKVILKYGDVLCYSLISNDNWQALENFLVWGSTSQDQINALKKRIVNRIKVGNSLGALSGRNWSLFEKFVSWCFNTDEEINQFKKEISPYTKMENIIDKILFSYFNFDFAEKFLAWCFPLKKEKDIFKENLMFSKNAMFMLIKFVSNYKAYGSGYSHWDLVRKLTEWFSPFEKEILIEFKEEFKKEYYKFNGQDANQANLKSFFFLLDSYMFGI